MQKKYRLSGRRTFSYIYAKGSRSAGRYMTLIYHSARRGLHIGIVAGKKVGKSVVRNKVKRRIKEIARRFIPCVENGYNYIVVASPAAAKADFSSLCLDLVSVFERAGKLKDKEGAIRAVLGKNVPDKDV